MSKCVTKKPFVFCMNACDADHCGPHKKNKQCLEPYSVGPEAAICECLDFPSVHPLSWHKTTMVAFAVDEAGQEIDHTRSIEFPRIFAAPYGRKSTSFAVYEKLVLEPCKGTCNKCGAACSNG